MPKKKSAQAHSDPVSILNAAVDLIATEGWEAFRLSELSKRADVPLSDVYAEFPDRVDVVAKFLMRLHARAGGMTAVDRSAPARDRLFDSIMQVFDGAVEDKPVLRVLVRDLPRDPITLIAIWSPIEQILGGIMDRAGMPLTGVLAPLRVLGLAGIVARALGVWIDDGPEQAKTMATLDGDLRRIEPVLGRVSPTRSTKRESGEEPRDTVH